MSDTDDLTANLVVGDDNDSLDVRLQGVADLDWVAAVVAIVDQVGTTGVAVELAAAVTDSAERIVTISFDAWLETLPVGVTEYLCELRLTGGGKVLTWPGPRCGLLRLVVRRRLA